MLAIQGTSLLGRIFLKDVLHGDAPARCGPHVSDVEVVSAVVVVVEPANAHARPRVLGTGLRRHIRESPVAMVICHCGAGEGSRWSAGKSKSVRLLAEPASTFIQKQQRAVGADDDEILASIIVDVNKEGAGGVFEHSHSSRVGDVLKGAVS